MPPFAYPHTADATTPTIANLFGLRMRPRRQALRDPIHRRECEAGYDGAGEGGKSGHWLENEEERHNCGKVYVAVDHRVDHLHALKLQDAQFRGRRHQYVARLDLVEIAEWDALQDVTDFDTILKRHLVSD